MNHQLRTKLSKRIAATLANKINGDGLRLLLQDIRILLEELGEGNKYPMLKLHCDWVLHAQLSGPKIRRILKEFDEHWDNWITHQIPIPESFANQLPNIVAFFGFESEFSAFLIKHNFSGPIDTISRDKWQGFERLFCGIVEDCRLRYVDSKHPLKHIDGATVRMYEVAKHPVEGKTYAPGNYLPFGIVWTFTKDTLAILHLTVTFPSKSLVERDNLQMQFPSSFKNVRIPPPRS